MSGVASIILMVPVAIAAAAACARRPAAAVVTVFVLTGFAATVSAYLGLPPAGLADLVLGALWLGVLWSIVRGDRERPLWLWAGLAVPALYLALTAASILASEPVSPAFDSFRLAGWHMAALFLVALAPWSRESLGRIARGAIAVALAVGLYAVFRKLAGPGSEQLLHQRAVGPGARSAPPQFFSSFFTAQELAAWCGMLVPFALAAVLAWRGRWRVIAALAGATCSFAMLAADRRAAVVGAVAGAALVVALFLFASRPFGAQRLRAVFVATSLAAMVAIGVFAVTVSQSPRTSERFRSLVEEPTEDYTYRFRLPRWEAAMDTAADEPFGHGLGTVGEIGESRRDRRPIAPFLDSSYLKIAVEQGFPMLALFAAGMIWLLVGLAWRGVNSVDPQRAALAIGACGTLVAMQATFYSSFQIERLGTLAGWLIVGLGAAQFTRVDPAEPRPAQTSAHAAPRRLPARRPKPRAAEPKQPVGVG